MDRLLEQNSCARAAERSAGFDPKRCYRDDGHAGDRDHEHDHGRVREHDPVLLRDGDQGCAKVAFPNIS